LARIGYNERSWAIDLISETNLFLAGKKRKVRSAGGENTVTAEDGRLFPDVLLYGDEAKGELVQGWELKFPDTSINDSGFIENATLKADLLNLDSFLLWNVREAVYAVRVSELLLIKLPELSSGYRRSHTYNRRIAYDRMCVPGMSTGAYRKDMQISQRGQPHSFTIFWFVRRH